MEIGTTIVRQRGTMCPHRNIINQLHQWLVLVCAQCFSQQQ